MAAAPIARRGLLRASALTSGLALAGLRPEAGSAASNGAAGRAAATAGMIVAHIRLDPSRGASIRLTELDGAHHPVRQLGVSEMTLSDLYDGGVATPTGNPVRRVCERAEALAHEANARTGQALGYKAWLDIV